MQGAREEKIFAAGFRQASCQGPRTERTQRGEKPADKPYTQDRPRRLEIGQPETAGGKDPVPTTYEFDSRANGGKK